MRVFTKAGIRLCGFALTSLLLVLTLACINRPMRNSPPDPDYATMVVIPQSSERDVDILFVIDNSGSMEDEQENLRLNFSALMESLRGMNGGLPNVHVGVASTDLGTSSRGSQAGTRGTSATHARRPGRDAHPAARASPRGSDRGQAERLAAPACRGCRRARGLAGRGDHFRNEEIVARESVLTTEPTETTAECQSGDAGRGVDSHW